jgi:hypothetical protein
LKASTSQKADSIGFGHAFSFWTWVIMDWDWAGTVNKRENV